MANRPTTILLSAEESLRLARESAARNKKSKRGSSSKRPKSKDIFKAMMADAGARLAAMKKNK